MTLRKKKGPDIIYQQVAISAVRDLQLAWDVLRRERRKQLALRLMRHEKSGKLKKKTIEQKI